MLQRRLIPLLVISLLGTASLLAGVSAQAQQKPQKRPTAIEMAPKIPLTPKGLTDQEKQFVASTVRRSLAAVVISEAVDGKAASADVKRFAEKMAADHRSIANELGQFVTRKGAKVPTDMGAERRAQVGRLSSLKGAAFDRAYAQWSLRECGQAASEFQKVASLARDHGVRAWVNKSLPLVHAHLKLARQLASSKPAAKR
jgi:putative membrane protein